ncbi:MAG TPA: hypothetical protein VJ777_17870, partial [Mycobacterium sp.]|nr:hypothetical protein [Mycobacterium sp.]
LVTDPSPLLGSALLTNLMILKQQLAEKPSKSLLRSSAALGQTYGLWLGNAGELGGANHWYRSCTQLAERSGDTSMLAYTLGRSASRGIYEDWTVQRTLDTAAAALDVTSRPTLGGLEAHAARVGVYALTKDAAAGRAALQDMAEVAEQLPAGGQTGPGPRERLAFLAAFFECRAGSLDDATAACIEAEPILATSPTWWIETQVYWARAMVAAGDVRGGLAYALQAIGRCQHDVRVIRVAARDVCQAVPGGYRGDDLAALWQYADRSPGPWETLR